MDMTVEGRHYLMQVLEEAEVKTLRFYGVPGCCGISVGVGLESPAANDEVEMIEGIQVAIDPQVKELLADVTIHAAEEDGEIGLVLAGYAPAGC
ncbi:MAG: Fe-S cluster assembly protein HesB [Lysinibacillus sp.]